MMDMSMAAAAAILSIVILCCLCLFHGCRGNKDYTYNRDMHTADYPNMNSFVRNLQNPQPAVRLHPDSHLSFYHTDPYMTSPPRYTLVSGLPSYEEAIKNETARISTANETTVTSKLSGKVLEFFQRKQEQHMSVFTIFKGRTSIPAVTNGENITTTVVNNRVVPIESGEVTRDRANQTSFQLPIGLVSRRSSLKRDSSSQNSAKVERDRRESAGPSEQPTRRNSVT